MGHNKPRRFKTNHSHRAAAQSSRSHQIPGDADSLPTEPGLELLTFVWVALKVFEYMSLWHFNCFLYFSFNFLVCRCWRAAHCSKNSACHVGMSFGLCEYMSLLDVIHVFFLEHNLFIWLINLLNLGMYMFRDFLTSFSSHHASFSWICSYSVAKNTWNWW